MVLPSSGIQKSGEGIPPSPLLFVLQHELVIHEAAQCHCCTDNGSDGRHPADQRFGHAVALVLVFFLVVIGRLRLLRYRLCTAGCSRHHTGAFVRSCMRCPARELCPHSGIQYTGLLCSRFFRLWFCFTARCTHDPGRLLLHGRCAHNAGRLFSLRGKRRFQFRLGLGRLFRLQQGVQRVLQQDAVAAALRAVNRVLFLRGEGTAGTVPAVLEHRGHTCG